MDYYICLLFESPAPSDASASLASLAASAAEAAGCEPPERPRPLKMPLVWLPVSDHQQPLQLQKPTLRKLVYTEREADVMKQKAELEENMRKQKASFDTSFLLLEWQRAATAAEFEATAY